MPGIQYHLTKKSSNSKTGPIAVSTTGASSCPIACTLRGKGCYAERGPLSWHWAKVSSGVRGYDLDTFCDKLLQVKAGTPFRHDQAGDFPHIGDRKTLDRAACFAIADAARHLDGWSYTHYPLTFENVETLRGIAERGFCVNVSADSAAAAEWIWESYRIPAVCIVASDAPARIPNVTSGPIALTVVCPEQTGAAASCAECMLCARPDRRVNVAFRLH